MPTPFEHQKTQEQTSPENSKFENQQPNGQGIIGNALNRIFSVRENAKALQETREQMIREQLEEIVNQVGRYGEDYNLVEGEDRQKFRDRVKNSSFLREINRVLQLAYTEQDKLDPLNYDKEQPYTVIKRPYGFDLKPSAVLQGKFSLQRHDLGDNINELFPQWGDNVSGIKNKENSLLDEELKTIAKNLTESQKLTPEQQKIEEERRIEREEELIRQEEKDRAAQIRIQELIDSGSINDDQLSFLEKVNPTNTGIKTAAGLLQTYDAIAAEGNTDLTAEQFIKTTCDLAKEVDIDKINKDPEQLLYDREEFKKAARVESFAETGKIPSDEEIEKVRWEKLKMIEDQK